ncbi:MAG: hypothetical protein MHM6MM_006721 [Cercozoa sp. M6MM]
MDENRARSLLVSVYERHNPEKLKYVHSILEHYNTDRARLQLFRELKRKYPAYAEEAAEKREYYRAKLERFYRSHRPAKLPLVDRILDVFEGDEEALLNRLAGKYPAYRAMQVEQERLRRLKNVEEMSSTPLPSEQQEVDLAVSMNSILLRREFEPVGMSIPALCRCAKSEWEEIGSDGDGILP